LALAPYPASGGAGLGRLKRAWLAGALGKLPSATSATLERCTQYGAGSRCRFPPASCRRFPLFMNQKNYLTPLDFKNLFILLILSG
jgi:hypothetical protein